MSNAIVVSSNNPTVEVVESTVKVTVRAKANAVTVSGAGLPGPTGAYVASAAFVGDDLVLTLSNDETVTIAGLLPDLKGDPGDDGADALALQIQYSADGLSWSATYTAGDIYCKFSADGGSTWGDAIRIRGENGADGDDGADAPAVKIQYSSDNVSFHDTFTTGDTYIRFSVDNGSAWTSGYKFVGSDGAGAGDVVGPASATDGYVALFDGITGKLLKVGSAPYSLPTATDSVLGGVKVGTGLTITDGVLAASAGADAATVLAYALAIAY